MDKKLPLSCTESSPCCRLQTPGCDNAVACASRGPTGQASLCNWSCGGRFAAITPSAGHPADRASSGRAVWEGRRPPWTGSGQLWTAEGHVLPGWACSGMLGQQRPPPSVQAASSLWRGHVAGIGAQDGRGLVGPVSGCRGPVAGGQHGDIWKLDSFSQTSFHALLRETLPRTEPSSEAAVPAASGPSAPGQLSALVHLAHTEQSVTLEQGQMPDGCSHWWGQTQ